jgi:regulator of protease activity HflC (stomatin/prohibitin superfamily)
LFGAYKGSTRENGLRYANPFMKKDKISLKTRNLNGEKLKVNDLTGNPIEIAAVVVWKVVNTAEALFDVDDYEGYVHIQSESAVRHLANFDDDRKATMISNLLVVLCSEHAAQPVVNTGTIYQ